MGGIMDSGLMEGFLAIASICIILFYISGEIYVSSAKKKIADEVIRMITDIVVYDKLIKETENAWILQIDDREVPLPKSNCTIHENKNEIEVPLWLILEEGLDDYVL
jgi:hypothetical protein